MNSYEKCELIGRNKVYSMLDSLPNVVSYSATDNQYCFYDIEVECNNNKMINIEVKDRKFTSNTYSTTIIEWSKFFNNVSYAKEHQRGAVLAVSYSDNIIRLWNLTYCYNNNKYTKGTIKCPYSYCGSKKITTKDVVYFDNNDAFLTYKLDKLDPTPTPSHNNLHK